MFIFSFEKLQKLLAGNHSPSASLLHAQQIEGKYGRNWCLPPPIYHIEIRLWFSPNCYKQLCRRFGDLKALSPTHMVPYEDIILSTFYSVEYL